MKTFEQYAAEAGNVSATLQRAIPETFAPDQAFCVEITGQESTVSKNGYTQLVLSLSIVKDNGELKNAGKVWESLPVNLPTDIEEAKAAQLEQIFTQNTHSLLRAADPVTFSVYGKAEKVGGRWTFQDSEGNAMTVAEKNNREAMMAKVVIGASKALVTGDLNLKGKRVYLVKKTAKNGKTYTSYFSEAPTKFPLASV